MHLLYQNGEKGAKQEESATSSSDVLNTSRDVDRSETSSLVD